jgi:hypothetical protein
VEAPDDGWVWHPKHVEQRTKENKNKIELLHLVGILLILTHRLHNKTGQPTLLPKHYKHFYKRRDKRKIKTKNVMNWHRRLASWRTAHLNRRLDFLWTKDITCLIRVQFKTTKTSKNHIINPLNAELNFICHLLALLEAHHILHVSRIRVNF